MTMATEVIREGFGNAYEMTPRQVFHHYLCIVESRKAEGKRNANVMRWSKATDKAFKKWNDE